jgi:radical SAM superfamily enzyme YgiQ (UPF0313 family)
MFKVFLCIPPDYDINYPPLGTPALCAFLKQKGVDACQADLNLKYRDFLSGHIRDQGLLGPQKNLVLKPLLKKFFSEYLKDRYYSDLLEREDDGLGVGLSYDNNTNSSFAFTERLLSSSHLGRYLEDKEENTFLQYYLQEGMSHFLEKEKVGLLGISLISPSQVIAGLTLGLLVKQQLPHVHVNIGGPWPTLFRRELMKRKDFFEYFDSVTVFEGETPLWRLAATLSTSKKIDIPNVITRDGEDDFSLTRTEEDLDALPPPDFDGLPLEKYEGNSENGAITATFETSRGCYWAKCAYCVDLPLPKPTYRRKDPRLVVRDMQTLKDKYGIKTLMFGDPGLSARQMLEISKEILKEKLDIQWWTMARLDPGFNRETFEVAARAGLKQVNFGFECASDRLCGSLNKGNKCSTSLCVIRECSACGIVTGLQTMLGLPQETWEEGLETINFLVTHKDNIATVAFNVYYVTPANYVYQDPKKYGLEIEVDPMLPFRFFIPFKNPKGLSRTEAQLLENLYYSLSVAGSSSSASEEEVGWETADERLRVDPAVRSGKVSFGLCGDRFDIFCLYHSVKGECALYDEQEQRVLRGVCEGEKVSVLRETFIRNCPSSEEADSVFKSFITGLVKGGFLLREQDVEMKS